MERSNASVRSHCLSPARANVTANVAIDAPLGPTSYGRMFPELPSFQAEEQFLHALVTASLVEIEVIHRLACRSRMASVNSWHDITAPSIPSHTNGRYYRAQSAKNSLTARAHWYSSRTTSSPSGAEWIPTQKHCDHCHRARFAMLSRNCILQCVIGHNAFVDEARFDVSPAAPILNGVGMLS